MYLLDTNVVSQFHKPQPDQGVLTWVAGQDETDLFISVITVMEIEIGVRRLGRRDQVQARRLQKWLEQGVLGAFKGRILPVDLDVAQRCAASHVPDPAPEKGRPHRGYRGFTWIHSCHPQ